MRRTLLPVLLLCGCSEYGLNDKDGPGPGDTGFAAPMIAVDPTSIDFGSLGVGLESAHTVDVSNVGHATLTVSDIYLADTSQPFSLTDADPMLLEPGASQSFIVTFQAEDADTHSTQVLVESDDPSSPEVPVSGCYHPGGRLRGAQVRLRPGLLQRRRDGHRVGLSHRRRSPPPGWRRHRRRAA